MKNPKTILFFFALSFSLIFQNCTSDENEVSNLDVPAVSPSNLNMDDADHATVQGFGPNSYWANYLVNQSVTNFLKGQHDSAASLFGMGNVPLYYAAGPGTFNALSFSAGYVVWGEELLANANTYGNAAIAYVAAHEIAHQVQFRTSGIPSRNHVSATELEADGFGGYYIRKRYTSNWTTAAQGYTFSQTLGGPVNSSHGSSSQRRSAYRLGYLIAENGNYTNRNFDNVFFYYYDQYVLGGLLKSEVKKPKNVSVETHDYISSFSEELQKIASGEISEEEFINLK
ncbi:Elastase precursor [Tenacibaculum sp. 190130A14a]|uniref:Metalloprotease n=1 Tax=Tenacibaculum polynesiense TaxID=3137857 RepID=A0ABP1F799_9FLAO